MRDPAYGRRECLYELGIEHADSVRARVVPIYAYCASISTARCEFREHMRAVWRVYALPKSKDENCTINKLACDLVITEIKQTHARRRRRGAQQEADEGNIG